MDKKIYRYFGDVTIDLYISVESEDEVEGDQLCYETLNEWLDTAERYGIDIDIVDDYGIKLYDVFVPREKGGSGE